MVELIILFVIVSAGSALVCSLTDKKYGDIVPISCYLLIFIELVLGYLFNLRVGMIIVMALALLCYLCATIVTIRRRVFKTVLGRIITPGLVFYLFCFALFFYINHGKYFSNWDEFSHWGDVVRAMTQLDDFGTNPKAMSLFPSYPPAMSIFQYFIEKIHGFIQTDSFKESLAYDAYQILMISFFLPFIERIGTKNKVLSMASGLVFLMIPMTVFRGVYSSVYIDPFLGVLAGIGFAIVLFFDDESIYKSLFLGAVLGVLVYAKESGILFSCIVVGAYLVKLLQSRKYTKMANVLWAALGFLIPKAIWELEIKKSGVSRAFGEKIDFIELGRIIFHKESNYKSEVWQQFWDTFSNSEINWGRLEVPLSFLGMCIVVSLILIIASIILVKRGSVTLGGVIASDIAVLLTLWIFVIGTAVSYMYKFSEYEARNLASFDRYINTVYVMLFVYMFVMLLFIFGSFKKHSYVGLFVAILAFICVPQYEISNELSGFASEKSLYGTYELREFAKSAGEVCEGDSRIFFIAQEDKGFYKLIFRSLVRPNSIIDCWSIGEPFYDGDFYTKSMDSVAWQELLYNECGYVALYELNDYFYEEYASVFANPEDIAPRSLFRVNKETKLLEKIF